MSKLFTRILNRRLYSWVENHNNSQMHNSVSAIYVQQLLEFLFYKILFDILLMKIDDCKGVSVDLRKAFEWFMAEIKIAN